MIIAIFGLAPALIHPAIASEPATETAEGQHYRIEIRSTTLTAALKDLARQTSLEFARFSDISTKTVIVGPLSGSFTRTEALDQLLRGTGLTYRFVNERTVAIVAIVAIAPSPSPHSTSPPPLISSPQQSAAPTVTPAASEDNKKPQEPKSVGKKRTWLGRIAGFFALCGPLLAGGPAYCQNATADASSDTLQEVVVTAERRAEDVQTTPISVVAISGADLQAASVTNVNALQAVAPDLTVQSGNGTTELNIRGIGITPVGADEVGGVVVVRDGIVNTTAGDGLDMPFYDMADVEVLRGPQGTFSGDNSTGGAININSQNPNFRGMNGYATAKVGTYSDLGFQGAVNLPVNNTIAVRLAFNEEKRGSYFYDEGSAISGPNEAGPYFTPSSPGCAEPTCASSPVTNKTGIDPGNLHQTDARLGVLWKPTENFQSLTKIEVDDNDTDGNAPQPNINTFSPLASGLPCPTGHGTAPNCHELYYSGYSGSPYVLNSWDSAEKWDEDINMYSEEMRYTLPSGTVARLIAGDTEVGYDTLSNATDDSIDIADGMTNTATSQIHAYSAEFDLISPTTGAISWIGGAAWSFTNEYYGSYTTNTNPPYSAAAPSHVFWTDGEHVWTHAEGIFGQVSYQISPSLQFQAGARLGWDGNPAHGALEIEEPAPLPNIFLLALPNNGPRDSAVPTGKIGLNWTPVTGQYFYVFYARGYKPGLENLGTAPPDTKEFVNDYEVGWKGTLADGHVLTDIGAYYMQYYQMEESIFNPHNVTGTAVGNIPYSSIKGIEASMQSRFGHVDFDISADLNKSDLGNVIDAATYAFPSTYGITNQCAAGVTPNAGNTNCTNYTPYLVSLSGEQLPFSPLFQANATLKYTIPLGTMTVQPRVSYSFIGNSYASLFDINFFKLPAHSLVNAYIDWNAGPWTVTFFGTNVANKLYITEIDSTDEYYGAPRQIGMQVSKTF